MIANCSFSQTGYPKKLVIGNDTVIVMTSKQLQSVNALYLNYNECKETNDILSNGIDSCYRLFSLYDSTNSNLANQIILLKDKIETRDTIISYAIDQEKQYIKKIDRLSKTNKVIKLLGTISIGIIAALIIF